MNVKIRNKFIEIKYSVSNGLVIFNTNYRWFRILEIRWYRRSNGSVLKDTRFYGIPTSLSASIMAQNVQLVGPREDFLTHQWIPTGNK